MHMGGKDGILHNISHVVHIQSTGRVRRGEFVFNRELNS